jgi:hypothetical protein
MYSVKFRLKYILPNAEGVISHMVPALQSRQRYAVMQCAQIHLRMCAHDQYETIF